MQNPLRTVFLSVLICLFVVFCGYGQVETYSDLKVDGELWPKHERCVQHNMSGMARLGGELGPVFGEAFGQVRLWLNCSSKIAGSPLNAESNYANQRRHGVNIGLQYENFRVGVTVRRNAIHQVWPQLPEWKERGRFPRDNSARGAIQRCRMEETCPTIGYEDGVGPYIGYRTESSYVELVGPKYKWKELTYPWSAVVFRANLRVRQFRIVSRARTGGIYETTGDIGALVNVQGRFWIGARGGRIMFPGWQKPINRLALRFMVR